MSGENYEFMYEKSWVRGYVYKDPVAVNPRDGSTLGTLYIKNLVDEFGINEAEHTEQEIFNFMRTQIYKSANGSGIYPCNGGGFDTSAFNPHAHGIITVSHSKIVNWYNRNRISYKLQMAAQKQLEQEVHEFACWVTGNSYRIEIEDSYGNTLDVCGSIYGWCDADFELTKLVNYYVREYSSNKKGALIKNV